MSEGIPPGPEGRLGSIFDDMMVLRDSLSARASSWDRSGANKDFRCLPAGGTLDLADIPGAGCIRHLYFTITISPHSFGNPRYLRDLVLRAYWDQEDTPSVEVPFGDMFGQGHECIRFFRSLLVTVNEGMELIGGKTGTITVGFNAYFPMPFADGARITIGDASDEPVTAFYYYIDYEAYAQLPAYVLPKISTRSPECELLTRAATYFTCRTLPSQPSRSRTLTPHRRVLRTTATLFHGKCTTKLNN